MEKEFKKSIENHTWRLANHIDKIQRT